MDVVDKKKGDELVRQEDALNVYLASLLGGMPEQVVEEPDTRERSKTHLPNAVENTICEPPVKTVQQVEKNITHIDCLKQESEIKCLSAVVSGLNILIPADVIDDIRNVTNCLKPSSAMPSWIYELEDEADDAIVVINTQKVLFEGLKSQRLKPNQRIYAVLLDDGAWGLACDSIDKVVTIKNNAIKWRGENSKRSWLAGTSQTYEAVLLDVKSIEKILLT